ncbi:chitin deacetylase [Mortierella sp. AD011]|nr:chitin deacetylase [Mortierella sp. AD010]KAF9399498.1 chitin deacetylase [Mortierella sp. AD011]
MLFAQVILCPRLISIVAYTISAICVQAASSGSSPSTVTYPRIGAIPSINSPEVQGWLKEIDLSGAPLIGLNHGVPPDCPAKIDSGVCYWTCQSCAKDDVVACPNPNVWGLTFDDGPTEVTTSLLKVLHKENVKATFFLIGGNVVQFPEVVKAELEQGHHLASHTWSHHALTTLTNEQIVAEMKWTEKSIEDATGYRVKYMRPSYGDVDNRVRFVLKKLGYIIVDWTRDAFDTNDWKIPMKQANVSSVTTHFKKSVTTYNANKSLSKKGFISLEHDLSVETVRVAKELIPYGASHGLIIQSIPSCLHDATPYAAINGVVKGVNGSRPTTGSSGMNAGAQSQKGKDDMVTYASVSSSTGASRYFLGNALMLSPATLVSGSIVAALLSL